MYKRQALSYSERHNRKIVFAYLLLPGINAVSYTHLDVYKRQPLMCIEHGLGKAAGFEQAEAQPVSYTHLDVYKRQPITVEMGLPIA